MNCEFKIFIFILSWYNEVFIKLKLLCKIIDRCKTMPFMFLGLGYYNLKYLYCCLYVGSFWECFKFLLYFPILSRLPVSFTKFLSTKGTSCQNIQFLVRSCSVGSSWSYLWLTHGHDEILISNSIHPPVVHLSFTVSFYLSRMTTFTGVIHGCVRDLRRL